MRIRSTFKESCAKLTNIFIILIIVSYAGISAGYKGNLLLIGLFLVMYLFLLMQTKSIQLTKTTNMLAWKMLLFYSLFNSLFNVPRSLFYLLVLICAYLIMRRKTNETDITFIVKLLKVVSIVLAVSIFVQYLLPDLFYAFAKVWFFYSNQYSSVLHVGTYVHQYSGLFCEVSYSAFILSIGCCICFAELFVGKRKLISNIAFLIIMYGAIILTGKRSLMLIIPAALIGTLIIRSFSGFTKGRIRITSLITIFIIILAVTLGFGQLYDSVVLILTNGDGSTIQLSSREKLWDLALEMFVDNPIFGKGLNSYDQYFNQSDIRSDYYSFAGAHNSYLQILAEMGLSGLIMYIWILVANVKNGIVLMQRAVVNNEKYKAMYLFISVSSVITILAYGISGNIFHQPQQMIALFLFFNVFANAKNYDENSFCDLNR